MFLQMPTTPTLQYNELTHSTMSSQDPHHTIDIIIAIRRAVVG